MIWIWDELHEDSLIWVAMCCFFIGKKKDHEYDIQHLTKSRFPCAICFSCWLLTSHWFIDIIPMMLYMFLPLLFAWICFSHAWQNCWHPADDYRLFCGDLGNEVNDDVLSKAFSRFPSFNMAKVSFYFIQVLYLFFIRNSIIRYHLLGAWWAFCPFSLLLCF